MKKIKMLTNESINKNLKLFNNDCKQSDRYASFDYCFNYFQEKYKNGEIDKIANSENIQLSCLQLGFYLASWGMYRGSTFLLQKSVKIYEPLIKYIASKECDVWDIDVDNYTNDNINKLIECGKKVKEKVKELDDTTKKATETLVTKIMLGVFGSVPAFDGYFKQGSNLGTFNENSLKRIKEFYKENSGIISDKAKEIKTFEYKNRDKGKRTYTKAKIIDMIFFVNGLKLEKDKKKKKRNCST